MARLALLLLLALGACRGGPAVLRVDRARGVDGGWRLPDAPVRLDATGDVVTLNYAGRTFVFRGVGEFEGHLSGEHVRLRSDALRILLTPEELRVEERAAQPGADPLRNRWALADLPEGARLRYEKGALIP